MRYASRPRSCRSWPAVTVPISVPLNTRSGTRCAAAPPTLRPPLWLPSHASRPRPAIASPSRTSPRCPPISASRGAPVRVVRDRTATSRTPKEPIRQAFRTKNPCRHWVPGAGFEPARSEELRGLSLRPTVTTGVAQAELVVPSRPFRASIAVFVTARALECERFRVVRDYFRDCSRPVSNPARAGVSRRGGPRRGLRARASRSSGAPRGSPRLRQRDPLPQRPRPSPVSQASGAYHRLPCGRWPTRWCPCGRPIRPGSARRHCGVGGRAPGRP